MSLRFSIDEALEKGWITQQQAQKQKAAAKEKQTANNQPRCGELPARAAPAGGGKPVKRERYICSLEGDMPQEKLWRACVRRWPGALAAGRLAWEFAGAVPDRKFRLDIAFPEAKLACEVDGWEFHGKFLSDFKRDRSRDRLLVQEGWRVLRFFAEEIHADAYALTSEIEKALNRGLLQPAEAST